MSVFVYIFFLQKSRTMLSQISQTKKNRNQLFVSVSTSIDINEKLRKCNELDLLFFCCGELKTFRSFQTKKKRLKHFNPSHSYTNYERQSIMHTKPIIFLIYFLHCLNIVLLISHDFIKSKQTTPVFNSEVVALDSRLGI